MPEIFPGYVVEIATSLFPDQVHDGRDCRQEVGREGQRCRICEDQYQDWLTTQRNVQQAIETSSLGILLRLMKEASA